MHASNIRNYVAVSKPFLSKRNILARVEWAKLHRTFDANRWDTVAFSDESSFTVRPTTLRKRVWRTSDTRFNNQNLVPTFKSGFVSISVWASTDEETIFFEFDNISRVCVNKLGFCFSKLM